MTDIIAVLVIVDDERILPYGTHQHETGFSVDILSSVEGALKYMKTRSYELLFVEDVFLDDPELAILTTLIKQYCVITNDITTGVYRQHTVGEILYAHKGINDLVKKAISMTRSSVMIIQRQQKKIDRIMGMLNDISSVLDGESKHRLMMHLQLTRIEQVLNLPPLPPEAIDDGYVLQPIGRERWWSKLPKFNTTKVHWKGVVWCSLLFGVLGIIFFASDVTWKRTTEFFQLITGFLPMMPR